jgi:hypothetical protein
MSRWEERLTEGQMPLWRQAVTDAGHPLYRAAWILFGEWKRPAFAAETLADQREAVVPFLLHILDSPELYPENGPGDGNAPINAVDLISEWKVEEAIPRLLQILQEEDWDTIVHDRTLLALENIGAPVIQPVLALARQSDDRDLHKTLAGVLADAGKGDPECFAFVAKVFDRQKDDIDIEYMAEMLLACDFEQGVAHLREQMQQRRFNRQLRKSLEALIREWDDDA